MISDFQLALIAIAIAFVVAVVIYNRWQEAKYKRRAERAFAGDHHDVLVENDLRRERVEPSLGGIAAASTAATLTPSTLATGDTDDDLSPIGPIDSPHHSAKMGLDAEMPSAVNPETDSVALILADSPIEPDRYHAVIGESQHISKGISWEGMVGGLWRPVPDYDSAGYREMRVGIQLADRRGPIDADRLAAFGTMVSQFASSVNAVSQREDTHQALARAAGVDAFCAESDVEICVNVIGKNGATFAVTKVRGLAEAQGMMSLDSGEYVMKDELGRVLYTLRNMDAAEPSGIRKQGPTGGYLNGLTFALDLPRTDRPVRVFENMVASAIKFADVLTGDVVDDNKRVLTANGRKVIAETIATITARMISKGVEPGSTIALRLYS